MKSLAKKMRNIYVRNKSVRCGLMKGYAIAAFIVQIVITVLFFFGIADAFGKKVYLLESINLILDVFSGYWVVGVGGALLAILYYVFLIIMIKNIIVSIRFLTNCLKDHAPDTVNRYGMYIAGRLGGTFFSAVIFLVIARMVSAYTLSPLAIIVIVLGMVFYVAYWAFSTICEPYDLTVILSRSLGNAMSALAVMFLFTLACKVDIPTVCNTFMFLFNSVGLFDTMPNQDIVNVLFYSLISPIFLIVIQIMILKYTEKLLSECDDFHVQDNISKSSGIFWACIIYAIVVFVAAMFVGTAVSADGMILLIKNNMSWICCAVVIFVIPKAVLPKEVTKKFTGTLGGTKKKAEQSPKKGKIATQNKAVAQSVEQEHGENSTGNIHEDVETEMAEDNVAEFEAPADEPAQNVNAPFAASVDQITSANETAPQPAESNVQPANDAQSVNDVQPNPQVQGNPNMYNRNYAPQGHPNPQMQGNPNMYNGNYAPQGQPNPQMQGNPNMYNRNYAPQGQPNPQVQGNPNMYNRNYAPQGQPNPQMQGNPNMYNRNYAPQGQPDPQTQANSNAYNQNNTYGGADNQPKA